MNSWKLEASVVLQGGGSIQEHPWESGDCTRASVWRTDVHRDWLMRLPQAHRHHIDQDLYGAAGMKPTCLRALNLGHPEVVAAALSEGQELWRTRPATKLVGKTATGAFRTSAAKEYSSALCRSIVVAMVKGLYRRTVAEGLRDPGLLPTLSVGLTKRGTLRCPSPDLLTFQIIRVSDRIYFASPREKHLRPAEWKKIVPGCSQHARPRLVVPCLFSPENWLIPAYTKKQFTLMGGFPYIHF